MLQSLHVLYKYSITKQLLKINEKKKEYFLFLKPSAGHIEHSIRSKHARVSIALQPRMVPTIVYLVNEDLIDTSLQINMAVLPDNCQGVPEEVFTCLLITCIAWCT
jgi:hypothetical protein